MTMELRAYLSYNRKHLSLSYWCSKHGKEVDFIIGDDVAIEVKATHNVSDKQLKGIRMLKEEQICNKYFLVSFDRVNKQIDNIHIVYWEDFLEQLWSGTYNI